MLNAMSHQVNAHMNVKQHGKHTVRQEQTKNWQCMPQGLRKTADNCTIPHKQQGHSKKTLLDALYREALHYVVEGSDNDTQEMKTCAKLYRLGIDPRLIFFHKTLTQNQREHAIDTLTTVARDVEIPRVLIVFTPEIQQERSPGRQLKIPYDFDAHTIKRLLKEE